MTTVEERIFRNVHEIVAEVQEEQPRGQFPVLGEVNPVGASDEGPEEKPTLYPGDIQPLVEQRGHVKPRLDSIWVKKEWQDPSRLTGFSITEGELDSRAFWKLVPRKVLDLDLGNLIEPEKALEGYGVYKGHHHSLTDPSPNLNAIHGSGDGGRPGRKWDLRVVFIQLSELSRGYRLDA